MNEITDKSVETGWLGRLLGRLLAPARPGVGGGLAGVVGEERRETGRRARLRAGERRAPRRTIAFLEMP